MLPWTNSGTKRRLKALGVAFVITMFFMALASGTKHRHGDYFLSDPIASVLFFWFEWTKPISQSVEVHFLYDFTIMFAIQIVVWQVIFWVWRRRQMRRDG